MFLRTAFEVSTWSTDEHVVQSKNPKPSFCEDHRYEDHQDVLIVRKACGRALALDFVVVNAVGPNHRDATFAAPAGAAAAYAIHKRRHQRTEALCREAGVPSSLRRKGA